MKIRYRLLEPKDKVSYLELMSTFGMVDLNRTQWEAWFDVYDNSYKEVFLGIVDDVNLGEIVVCSAALLYEEKVYHNMGRAAHLEDVAVLPKYQGLGIGKALIKHMIEQARSMGCYKIILDCSDKNVGFYEKLGFKKHETGMRISL